MNFSDKKLFLVFAALFLALPLADATVVSYFFNEPSANQGPGGTDLTDYAGNSFHGNEVGGVSIGLPGNVDKAFVFDGVDDRVEVADRGASALDVPYGRPIAIEAWIKPAGLVSTPETYRTIVAKGGTAGDNGFNYALRTNGKKLEFYYFSDRYNVFTTTNDVVDNGNWYHVSAKYVMSSGGTLKLFVNGVQQPGAWNTICGGPCGSMGPYLSDQPLWIGAVNFGGGASQFFSGSIDELEVLESFPSDSEFSQHYYSRCHEYNHSNLNVVFNSDLSGCARVLAPNVVLNCNNFNVNFSDRYSGTNRYGLYGISVEAPNTSVANCKIVEGSATDGLENTGAIGVVFAPSSVESILTNSSVRTFSQFGAGVVVEGSGNNATNAVVTSTGRAASGVRLQGSFNRMQNVTSSLNGASQPTEGLDYANSLEGTVLSLPMDSNYLAFSTTGGGLPNPYRMVDYSGNGLDGYLYHVGERPGYDPNCIVGGCTSFDGAFDFFYWTPAWSPNNGLPVSSRPGDNTTVSFWMYWDGNVGAYDNIDTLVSWAGYALTFDRSVSSFGFRTPGGELWGIPHTGLVKQWAHVTAVFYNGDARRSRLYIDGVERTMSQKVGATVLGGYSVGSTMSLGHWIGYHHYFRGRVDEFRLWNRTVLPAEAKYLYESSKPVDGRILSLPLQELQGQATKDYSGYANNVTLEGGFSTTPVCKVGRCFSFDGIDDAINVSDSILFKPRSVTVSAWVKLDSLAASTTCGGAPNSLQYIVFKRNSRSTKLEGYALLKQGNNFAFRASASDGTQDVAFSTTPAAVGQWVHLAGVFERPFLRLYVNGELESEVRHDFDLDYNTRPLYVGRTGECNQGGGAANFDAFFEGSVDEVNVWGRALSAQEVRAAYAPGSGGIVSSGINNTVFNSSTSTSSNNSFGFYSVASRFENVSSSSLGLSSTVFGGRSCTFDRSSFAGTLSINSSNSCLFSNNVFSSVQNNNSNRMSFLSNSFVNYVSRDLRRSRGNKFVSNSFTFFSASTEDDGHFASNLVSSSFLLGGTSAGEKASGWLVANNSFSAPSGAPVLISAHRLLESSNNSFYNNSLASASSGFSLANASRNLFEANSISCPGACSPTQKHVEIFGSSQNNLFLNNSLNYGKVSWPALPDSSTANLTVAWYLGVKVVNQTLTVPDSTVHVTSTMPQDGLLLSLHFENNSRDSSPQKNDAAAANDPAYSTACRAGGCYSFDGVDDNFAIPDAPSLRPQRLTLSAWINTSNLLQTGCVVAKQRGSGLDNSYALSLLGGRVAFCVDGSGSCSDGSSDPAFLPPNTWVHYAGTYDGSQTALYRDGVLVNTNSSSQSSIAYDVGFSSSPVFVGADSNDGLPDADNCFFDGKIDEVNLWNRTLSPSEVNQLFAETIPFNQYLSLSFEENFNDASGYGLHALPAGTPSFLQSGCRQGACAEFDSFSDRLDLNNLPVSTRTGDNTTVAFWMYWNGSFPGAQEFTMPFGWQLYSLAIYNSTTGSVSGFGFHTGNSDLWGTASMAGLAGKWVHVVAVFRNGDAKRSRLFLNGVEQSLSQRVGATPASGVASANARISGWAQSTTFGFQARIDEFRAWNRSLSEGEVRQIYFQAGQDDALMMHLPLEGDVHDRANQASAALRGAPEFLQACGRGGCFNFDGGGDYVDASNPFPALGRQYSVSAWINPESVSGTKTIAAYKRGDSGNGVLFNLERRGNDARFTVTDDLNNGASALKTNAFTAGGWYHVVGVRDLNSLRVYVNGFSSPAATATFGPITSNKLSVGVSYSNSAPDSSSLFNGGLDEVKVWKRSLSEFEVKQLYSRGSETPRELFSSFTAPGGLTKQLPVVEFKANSTSRAYSSPYMVEASKVRLDGRTAAASETTPVSRSLYFQIDLNLIGCGSAITQNFALTQDLSSPSSCLAIAGDDVVLDCRGKTITFAQGAGSDRTGMYGISVEGRNATIHNCTVVEDGGDWQGFTGARGVAFSSGASGSLLNSSSVKTVSQSGAGVVVQCANCTVNYSFVNSTGRQATGIALLGGSSTIFNSTVRISGESSLAFGFGGVGSGGLLVSGPASNNSRIYNVTVNSLNNSFGLYVRNSSLARVSQSIFSSDGTIYSSVQVASFSSSLNFSNNLLSQLHAENSAGISFHNSTVAGQAFLDGVNSSLFRNNSMGGGLVLSSSNRNSFTANNLSSPSSGIQLSSSSNNSFEENTVVCPGGCLAGFASISSSSSSQNNFFLNNSLDFSLVSWPPTQGVSNLSIAWYFQVNVTNRSRPVDAAIVNITNATSSQKMLSSSTNPLGLTPFLPFLQFSGNNTVNTSFTPHVVWAGKTIAPGLTAEATENATVNRTFVFEIDLAAVRCGRQIIESGELAGDISASASCISIAGAGVVLDCKGKTITFGQGAGNDRRGISGILVNAPRVVVANCRVVESGAEWQGFNGATAINLTSLSAGSLVANNSVKTVSQRGVGILAQCSNCNLANNSVNSTGSFATAIAVVGQSNLVAGNQLNSSGVSSASDGFGAYGSASLLSSGSGNTLANNSVNALNSSLGLLLLNSSNARVSRNSLRGDAPAGSAISSSYSNNSLFEFNNASTYSGVGGGRNQLFFNRLSSIDLSSEQAGAMRNNFVNASSLLPGGSAPALALFQSSSGWVVEANYLESGDTFAVQLSGLSGKANMNNSFHNNSLSSRKGAVTFFRSANNSFANSTFRCPAPGCLADFQSVDSLGGSSNSFVNSTLNYSAMTWGSGVNNLSISWYLTVKVVDVGGAIQPGAVVNVTNSTSSQRMVSAATDSAGRTPALELVQFLGNNTANSSFTPHVVDAVKNERVGVDFVDLNSSQEFVLSLGAIGFCSRIPTPGEYFASRNLVSSGSCMFLDASGVQFDCRGKTITFANSTATDRSGLSGILVNSPNNAVSNCRVVESGAAWQAFRSATAINFSASASQSNLTNSSAVTVSQLGTGIAVRCADCNITHSTADSRGAGTAAIRLLAARPLLLNVTASASGESETPSSSLNAGALVLGGPATAPVQGAFVLNSTVVSTNGSYALLSFNASNASFSGNNFSSATTTASLQLKNTNSSRFSSNTMGKANIEDSRFLHFNFNRLVSVAATGVSDSVLSANSINASSLASENAIALFLGSYNWTIANNSLEARDNFLLSFTGESGRTNSSNYLYNNSMVSRRGLLSSFRSSNNSLADNFFSCGAQGCRTDFTTTSMGGNSSAAFLNSSLNYSAASWGSGSNNLSVAWYLRVTVLDSGSPAAGAVVNLTNASSSTTPMASATTDAAGRTPPIALFQLIANNSATAFFTPHVVDAIKNGVLAAEGIEMNSTRSLSLTLGSLGFCARIPVAGSYTLSRDVVSSGSCVVLDAPGIRFDCGGKKIVFANTTSLSRTGLSGIFVNSSNTAVSNCDVSEASGPAGHSNATGVNFSSAASQSNFTSSRISISSQFGRAVHAGCSDCNFSGLAINSTGSGSAGIGLLNSSRATISFNNVSSLAEASVLLVNSSAGRIFNNSLNSLQSIRSGNCFFYDNFVNATSGTPAISLFESSSNWVATNNKLLSLQGFALSFSGPAGSSNFNNSFASNSIISPVGGAALFRSVGTSFTGGAISCPSSGCNAGFQPIFSFGNSSTAFLNSSLNYPAASWGSGVNNLSIAWFLDVFVTDGGTGVSGALVNITNASSTTPMVSLTTNFGAIPTQVLVQFLGNSTSNTSFTPHVVEAGRGTESAFQDVLLESSQRVVLAFGASACGRIGRNTVLDRDLNALRTCFTVVADNVILDCRGFKVTYAKAGLDADSFLDGVNNGLFARGVNNVTVQGCSFIQPHSAARGAAAIVFSDSNNSFIRNNSIATTGSWVSGQALTASHGVVVSGGNSRTAIISGNTISVNGSGSHGIVLRQGPANVTISQNNVDAGSSASLDTVLMMRLDEPAENTAPGGSDAQDFSVYGNHANQSGGVSFGTPGISGSALGFDGNNDFLDAGNSSSLRLTENFSIELWHYKTGGRLDNAGLVGKGSDPLDPNIAYQLKYNRENTQLVFSIGNGAATNSVTAPAPSENSWHHVVAVLEPSSLKLYVDGVLGGTATRSITPASTTTPLYIGRVFAPFQGKIDEVVIYNKTLQAADVAQRFASGSTLFGSSASTSLPIATERISNSTIRLNTLRSYGTFSPGILLSRPGENNSVEFNTVTTAGIGSDGIVVRDSPSLPTPKSTLAVLTRNTVTTAGGTAATRGIVLFNATGISLGSNTLSSSGYGAWGIFASYANGISLQSNAVTARGQFAKALSLGHFESSGQPALASLNSFSQNSFTATNFSSIAGHVIGFNNSFFDNAFVAQGEGGSLGLRLEAGSRNSFSRDDLVALDKGLLFSNTRDNELASVKLRNFTGSSIHQFSRISSEAGSRGNALTDAVFNASLLEFTSGSANDVSIAWSTRARVADSGGTLLSAAQVNISSPAGALLHLLTTDSNGLTPFVKVVEFTGNSTAGQTFNPFSFSALKPGYGRFLQSFSISSPATTQFITLAGNARPAPSPAKQSFLASIPALGAVFEYNSSGSLLWRFEGQPVLFAGVSDAVGLANNNTLVADANNHRVAEFALDGSIVWQYGVPGSPGNSFNKLNSPSSSMRLADGTTLVADTLNNRVISVDSSNAVLWEYSVAGPTLAVKYGDRVLISRADGAINDVNYSSKAVLWSYAAASGRPVRAYPLSSGNVLISDSLPGRVYELARILPAGGNVLWTTTIAGVRDAVELPSGSFAVANDSTLLLLSRDKTTLTAVAQLQGLPASVRPGLGAFLQEARAVERSGLSFLVADSGNKRVVELDQSMENVLWQYASGLERPTGVSSAENGKRIFIADSSLRKVFGVYYDNLSVFWQYPVSGTPADVKWVSGSLVLVTDSQFNTVQEVSYANSSVTWSFGTGVLNSPLGARPLPDGSVLVADSGNNRILKVQRNGQFTELRPSGTTLLQPYRADEKPNRNVVVADTGRSRLIEFEPGGLVVRTIDSSRFSAPSSVVAMPDDLLLAADQGRNRVVVVNNSGFLHSNYTQLNSPTDAVVGFDPSFYLALFSTQISPAESLALSKRVSEAFSVILAKGSIGSVQAEAFDNSLWRPYSAVGGGQVSSCTAGDVLCCSRSWCNQTALADVTLSIKQKAIEVANATAFRRGGGQPFQSIIGGAIPFAFTTVAQVAEAASLSTAGWQCSNCTGPGVFVLKALSSNASNPSNWSYSAEAMTFFASKSVERGQNSSLRLLGFVHANGTQIVVSSSPNLLSGNQLAQQALSSTSCSWPRVSCTAVRGACCSNAADGSCTAFNYTFVPSSATLAPVGQGCGNATITVSCSPSSFCGETTAAPVCPAVRPSTVFSIASGNKVVRASQDGLSTACVIVEAPAPPSFSVDLLWRQLADFVRPPVCIANSTGICPAPSLTAAADSNLINSVRISTQ